MNRLLHKITLSIACACALPFLTGCSMMEDENKDCPSGLFVRFVYDYNTQRADMFRDHVGHVTLYVYDEKGNKVAERAVSNTPAYTPLSQYGYSIHFADGDLKPGRYRLQAVAMQRDWEVALNDNGAKYRRADNISHSSHMQIHLDYAHQPIEGTNHYRVEHHSTPMDTLWHTLKVTSTNPAFGRNVPEIPSTKAPFTVYPLHEQFITVENQKATYATISLVRNTKHLDLTLRQIDDPDNMFDKDYVIDIIEPNASLDHDNEVLPGDSLLYNPYAQWTTRLHDGGISVDHGNTTAYQRTAHYNIMFNRLKFDTEDPNKGAVLRIRRIQTGKVVALMNLTQLLAQGRNAYEIQNYHPQEYLDREYDYHLDFLLKGDAWASCDIVINVLSWSKRIQNNDL